MGHLLPPPPADDPWADVALPLLDLTVMLRLDPGLAAMWARGDQRTLLGTTVVVREPLVRTVDRPGLDLHVPLDGVAVITLLQAMVDSGAAEESLAEVVHDLDAQHGGPVLAHRTAGDVLPGALADAADRLDVPSLRRPLQLTGDGWGLGPALRRTLSARSHDDDGWVTSVTLVHLEDVRVHLDLHGRGLVADGTVDSAPVHLFRHGWSLSDVATVLDRTVEDVEHTLRRRISP